MSKLQTFWLWFGLGLAGVIGATFLLWRIGVIGPTDAGATKRVLEGAGYTQVQTHGWAMFGCDSRDSVHTKFTAVGPSGHTVSGVVCKGWGFWAKGSTPRFN